MYMDWYTHMDTAREEKIVYNYEVWTRHKNINIILQ